MNPSICDSLDFVHGSGVSCSNVISHTFRSFKANKTYDMRSSEGEYSKPELLHLISLIFNSGRGILISLLKWARMYPSHTQCVQTRSLTQLCSSCAVSLQWRLSTIFTAVCDYTSTWCIQGQAARSKTTNAADTASSSSSSQLLFVPTAPLCGSIKGVREAKDCNKCINMKSSRAKSFLSTCLCNLCN